MKLEEIYGILDSISPFALQEKWDNSGLNIGDLHQEIESIYLALELTLDSALSLTPNSLVITHHPLIFSPLHSLETSRYPAKLIQMLLAKNIALISMHTNFDNTHLNKHFAQEILGFSDTIECGIAQSCMIEPIHIDSLALSLKQKLGLAHIRYTQMQSDISQIYIVCGSGVSFLREIRTPHSCLITGDIKYHDAMSAMCMDIGLIDVGHYPSEMEFPKILKSILQIKGLNAIMLANFSPFSYI